MEFTDIFRNFAAVYYIIRCCNRLVVSDLKLEKSEGDDYKGVLTGRLNGEDVTYDVTVTDTGSDFDVDWELRK